MAEHDDPSGLRARGEEAIGELAQALLDNPLLNSALGRALGAGERAAQAQRSAIGAMNLATAADLERLEQRLRSLSGRLEEIEDRVDEVVDELAAIARQARPAAAKPAPAKPKRAKPPRAGTKRQS